MGENNSNSEHILQRIKINNLNNLDTNHHSEDDREAATFTEQLHLEEQLPLINNNNINSSSQPYSTSNMQIKNDFKSKINNQPFPKFKHLSLYQKLISKNTIEAFLCFLGLTGSLVAYGILQERIMTVPFGNEKTIFKHSIFLVFCNRVVACCLAFILSLLFGKQIRPVAPIHNYSFVSIANVISSTCQYEALKYVVFSAQVLVKCSKIIPVMIWQTLISRKKYTIREYIEAAFIAIGCTLFLITGDIKTKNPSAVFYSAYQAYFYGGALLLIYLVVDGFTSTWQDKLFTGYDMDISNQVLYTTLCSVFLSSMALIGEGRLLAVMQFMKENPVVWNWILAISLASASVQFLVTYTIKKYGALVFATIMTTRQWFSILISSLVFMHPMSFGQWIGTLIVFGTLYHAFYQKRKHSSK